MIKYLYIDDDNLQDSQAKVSGLIEKGKIEIVVENNKSKWEDQVSRLLNVDYDGLILDLKLDEVPVDDGHRAKFRSTSLAQFVRDNQKDGVIPPLPIILFSGENKMKSSLDDTAKDLFDLCINKGEMVEIEKMLSFSQQLIAVSECYSLLNKHSDAVELLNAPTFVDERFTGELSELHKNGSIASCVHLLLQDFILTPGLLTDESLLAARLGVDYQKTTKDVWNQVLNLFDKALYRGVLGCAWKRWWMRDVNSIWREISDGQYLQMMDAMDRVEVLKNIIGVENITVAKKSN